MKILVLSQYYYPEKFLINDIVLNLSKFNSVTVLTGKPNYPSGVLYPGYKIFGIDIEVKGTSKVIRVPIIPRNKGFLSLLLNYISFILSTFFLMPFLVKRKEFDVILCYGLSPSFQSLGLVILNFFYKKPLVTWVQDLWPNSFIHATKINNTFLNFLMNCLNVFIYSHNSLILLQSRQFSESIKKFAPQIPQYYLPNPAPDDLTKYSSQDSLVKKSNGKFQVVFAGNLGHVQGLDVLLDAASLLNKVHSNIEFHIYGNGSYEKAFKEKIRKLNLSNIFIFGQLSLVEIRQKMLCADALMLSLINDSEINLTIPTKLQAYLSMGKPVIGVVSGEAQRIILEAKCGIIVEPGNSIQLCAALLEFSNTSRNQLEIMGNAALSYYTENFSMNKIISQLDYCLKSVLR